MQIKIKYALLLASVSLPNLSYANLYIYPSKGLFGVGATCEILQSPDADKGTSVDCEFINAVNVPGIRQQLNQYFIQNLKQDFSEKVVEYIDNTNKQRTFIASLEVLRAKHYEVKKESTTEIFLPVTLNLKLTNIITGEVLYSTSSTLNQPIKVLTAELGSTTVNNRIRNQFQSSLLSLSKQVTDQLKKELQLSEVKTEVLDYWKNYLILDKGYAQGIGRDDELSASDGGLIRVVQADTNYSVAIPVILSSKAKHFSKLTTSTFTSANKPKVLIADVLTYQDESKELVEQIFSGAIGENAAFTLTPVNKQYALLAQSIGEETKLAQAEDINRRNLPDFFIRLTVLPTIAFEQQKGAMTTQQVTYAQVMGELVDASGQIIFAAIADDKIEDVISSGMAFSLDARREIAIKNALLKLGDQFKSGVKFSKSDLKVISTSGQQIVIDDPAKRLSEGLSIKIFRTINTQGKQVFVPIWDAQINDRSGSQVTASLIFPVSGDGQQSVNVNKGDSIFLETGGNPGNLAQANVFCKNLPVEKLGDVEFEYYRPLSYLAFAKYSKFPLYATGAGLSKQQPLVQSVLAITKGAGFRTDLKPQFVIPQSQCLQPVYRINSDVKTQCNTSICDENLSITAGIRIFDSASKKIGAAGLEQKLNLKGVSQIHSNDLYQLELLKYVPDLLKKIVEKTDSPTTK